MLGGTEDVAELAVAVGSHRAKSRAHIIMTSTPIIAYASSKCHAQLLGLSHRHTRGCLYEMPALVPTQHDSSMRGQCIEGTWREALQRQRTLIVKLLLLFLEFFDALVRTPSAAAGA